MKTTESHTKATAAKTEKTPGTFFQRKAANNFFSTSRSGSAFFSGGSNRPGPVQPKLTIGPANDVYEKEADSMADKVVRRLAEPTPATVDPPRPVAKKLAPTPQLSPSVDAPVQKISPIQASTIQEKCAACEQKEQQSEEQEKEEPLQERVQKKPIFESNAEPPDDDKTIHRKADHGSGNPVSPNIEKSLDSSKGSGAPLPNQTRGEMESSFGKDFGAVRIHNDSQAADMSKGLQAQAFTRGNDIYFNSGKYNPASTSGKHLLAHELTHTVQQGNEGAVRKYPQMGQQVPTTDKQIRYYSHRNDVVDIQGMENFDPNRDLGNYISSLWEDSQSDAAVNIKFGNLASGFIFVRQTGSYRNHVTLPLPVFPDPLIVVPVQVDLAPDPENYQAAPQVIPFTHPAFNTEGQNGTLVLVVRIDAGLIWGYLGWIEGKTGDQIEPIGDASLAGTGAEDFKKLVFGKDNAEKAFTQSPDAPFFNMLNHGQLSFLFSGLLESDNMQQINGSLGIADSASSWAGDLETNIQGTDPYELPLDRTPEGYLSGFSAELELSGNWKTNGFEASGQLNISYAKGNLKVIGTAWITTPRLSGLATIALTDTEQAQQLFLDHVPAKKADTSDTPDNDSYLHTSLPDPAKPLAITAWGEMRFTLIDNVRKLDGEVAFVVSPEGYIVTAGHVRFRPNIPLIEGDKKNWNLAHIEHNETILVWGLPVNLSARGDVDAGYEIGDIRFAEIIASGVYSNHPNYASEFNLSGTFDVPSVLQASITVTLAAGPGVGFSSHSFTLAEAGVTLKGTATLNVYVRATPTIGIIANPGKAPNYRVAGELHVGGQLKVGLDASMEIAIHRIKKDNPDEDKKHAKKMGGMTWTIGDFGLKLNAEYILGSGKKPTFDYAGHPFDEVAFLEALEASRSNKAKGKAIEGGFEENGKEKGQAGETPFDPIHPPNEPVGPHAMMDTFSMDGAPHSLILTISGTADQPQAVIEMQTTRKKLSEKIADELDWVRSTFAASGYGVKMTEEQQNIIEQQIKDLQSLKEQAEETEFEARRLEENTQPEPLQHLGDSIANYGQRYQRQDLARTAAPPVQPTPPSQTGGLKAPPPGIDIVLNLPWQKGVYLQKYREYLRSVGLFHSTTRAQRDTNQLSKWNRNMKGAMLSEVKCKGVALGLFHAGTADPARDILRPFWTSRHFLGQNKAGVQMRMTVDHVIEYQLRPLSGGGYIDEPWNFELLDPSSNSSSGSKLDSNIQKERDRLEALTHDTGWQTDPFQFTKVDMSPGSGNAERYTDQQIEKGDHLNDYQRLSGTPVDKDQHDECMNKGGKPF
jgi:hypothetical protein